MISVAEPNGVATKDEARAILKHIRSARLGVKRAPASFPAGLAHLFVGHKTLFAICDCLSAMIEGLYDPATVERHGYEPLDFRAGEAVVGFYGLGGWLPLDWGEVAKQLPRHPGARTRPSEAGTGLRPPQDLARQVLDALALTLPCWRPEDRTEFPTAAERSELGERLKADTQHVLRAIHKGEWICPLHLNRAALADFLVARASAPNTDRGKRLADALDRLEDSVSSGEVAAWPDKMKRGKIYRRKHLARAALRYASEARQERERDRTRRFSTGTERLAGPRLQGLIKCDVADVDALLRTPAAASRDDDLLWKILDRAVRAHWVDDPAVPFLVGLLREAIARRGESAPSDLAVHVFALVLSVMREHEDPAAPAVLGQIERLVEPSHPVALDAAINGSIALSAHARFSESFALLQRALDDLEANKRCWPPEDWHRWRSGLFNCQAGALLREARHLRAQQSPDAEGKLFEAHEKSTAAWDELDNYEPGDDSRLSRLLRLLNIKRTSWQWAHARNVGVDRPLRLPPGADQVLDEGREMLGSVPEHWRLQWEIMETELHLRRHDTDLYASHRHNAAQALEVDHKAVNLAAKLAILDHLGIAFGADPMDLPLVAPQDVSGYSPEFEPPPRAPRWRTQSLKMLKMEPTKDEAQAALDGLDAPAAGRNSLAGCAAASRG